MPDLVETLRMQLVPMLATDPLMADNSDVKKDAQMLGDRGTRDRHEARKCQHWLRARRQLGHDAAPHGVSHRPERVGNWWCASRYHGANHM